MMTVMLSQSTIYDEEYKSTENDYTRANFHNSGIAVRQIINVYVYITISEQAVETIYSTLLNIE